MGEKGCLQPETCRSVPDQAPGVTRRLGANGTSDIQVMHSDVRKASLSGLFPLFCFDLVPSRDGTTDIEGRDTWLRPASGRRSA